MYGYLLEATTAAGAPVPSGGIWGMLLVYGAIFGVLYLLFIRPQSKRKKQEEELKKRVEVGDEITTIGGIMGKVISIKEETDSIVLESSVDKSRIRIRKWAIGTNHTLHEREAVNQPAKKPGLFGGLFGGKSKVSDEKSE